MQRGLSAEQHHSRGRAGPAAVRTGFLTNLMVQASLLLQQAAVYCSQLLIVTAEAEKINSR